MESLELIWEDVPGGAFTATAFVRGQVVGHAVGRWTGDDSCELELVEVLEGWRRRGIGNALVRAVQARTYHITARTASEAGARLLGRCGFVADEEPTAPWSWSEQLASTTDRDF